MCVVVIIAIQFKSANQRPQNLWLTGQKIVVSLCGHRNVIKKGKILSPIINQSDSCCLLARIPVSIFCPFLKTIYILNTKFVKKNQPGGTSRTNPVRIVLSIVHKQRYLRSHKIAGFLVNCVKQVKPCIFINFFR